MSQRLVTPFVNTNIPGAYPNITVQSQPVGLVSSGIIAIIGEADGGNSYQNVILKNNVFTPDQLSLVTQMYTSGQIVDAFSALSAPSNDVNITGSANQIYIIKTNSGVRASASVANSYGMVSALNWGVAGNSLSYQITATASEVAPTVSGTTIPSLGSALNSASFTIILEGSAATVVTLSSTSTDHDTITHLVSELNTLLPSGIVASAGSASSSIALTIAVDSLANRNGWGKSFELDDTSSDLAAFGLVSGLYVSSQEPSVEVAINNSSTGQNEILDVSEDVALEVGYVGTSATLTISDGMLTTTVAGGTGASLSIEMSQYKTVAALAAYIASQTGYSASATPAAQQLAPSALDDVSAIGILSGTAGLMPGRVKDSLYKFQQALNTSTALSFSASATAGLPDATALPIYLSGGARGATLSSDIINAIDQLAGIQVNIIVPLFSQDASLDYDADMTDVNSTYTIEAIQFAVKNHCIQYSTPKLKKNRIAILSQLDTYQNDASAAQSLANYRCSLAMQQCMQVNSQGVITTFQPWYAAAVAAGMQAGGFYKSITNKYANVISFLDPSGFDSGNPGDVEQGLSAGLLFLTQDTSGSRWVCDQTTYGFDTNFVYNSIQAVYDSDIVALDLASSFQAAFVGQSVADVSATAALSFLAQKMDGYKKLKLIAASSDAPLGYKNASISIDPPEMDVSVDIKLATAILFIPISINISQVQQSASS